MFYRCQHLSPLPNSTEKPLLHTFKDTSSATLFSKRHTALKLPKSLTMPNQFSCTLSIMLWNICASVANGLKISICMQFYQFRREILSRIKNLGSTSASTGRQPCGRSETAIPGQKRKQHLLASHRQQQFKQQIAKAEQTYPFPLGNSLSPQLLQSSRGNEICLFSITGKDNKHLLTDTCLIKSRACVACGYTLSIFPDTL